MRKSFFVFVFLFILSAACLTVDVCAQDGAVELDGDVIEASEGGNVVTASGNVVIVQGNVKLFCDNVKYFRATNTAEATGNVRLISSEGSEITGQEITYDFNTHQGTFHGARLSDDPYYGYGEKVTKVSEDKYVIENGYLTTSDYDKPEYRVASNKIDVYPGEKAVARNVRMIIGKIPLMYSPFFKHRLDDKEPFVRFIPGIDSEWGAFLLSEWRYYLTENVRGKVHLDYREKLDFGSGVDLEYKTPSWGDGILRTYYTQERRITSDRIWDDRPSPTPERERYKADWRHKWRVDNRTSMIAQYYSISDNTFLKDFFEREYRQDPSPDTFFLLTHALNEGTLSVRSDVRVNDYESKVERLPEVRYDLTNLGLGESGFYLQNTSSVVNLQGKTGGIGRTTSDTIRGDTDWELSYPEKVGILEVKPFVGSQHTYYTKALDSKHDDAIRGRFKTGTSVSTKFYRVFDVNSNSYGMDINRLRHIITPTVSYLYTSDPTIDKEKLNTFDNIDTLDREHNINFALENKLQTKRNDQTVELLRAIVSTDYRLKQDNRDSGFDVISTDVDFRPTNWVTFYFDSSYSTRERQLEEANFGSYINGKDDKWYLNFEKRYNREVDDIITTEFWYRINIKWAFRIFERFDLDTGIFKETELTLSRDLHSWEMDFNINSKRGEGTEFMLLFNLKAFPDVGVDFGSTFRKPESGSSGQ